MTARGSATAASTLLTGLQVYYKLEDETDSSGNALTLTNTNGVTFTAGKVNNAATFVHPPNENLTHVDATQYQMGTSDWSICAWFKTNGAITANQLVVYGQVGSVSYDVRLSGANILVAANDGTNSAFKSNNTTVNDSAWHLVIATFNRAGNISVYIDNGAAQTASMTAVTGSIVDINGRGFMIGQNNIFGEWWEGQIDEVGMWNRVITSTEISTLWNSGNGTTYPF